MNLHETLEEYGKKNIYPFHMPGHKRQIKSGNPYGIDMTEVEGVDDLHDPEGAIKFEQDRISRMYGSKESYILVGGSTVGNLSAIFAAVNEGEKVIIQRNSHKSVYNAVMIRHCKVEYVDTQLNEYGIYEAATYEDILSAYKTNRDVKAIVLTSPSYEGYHAQLVKISEFCKENEIILIVDQAHGAHLGFDAELTGSGVSLADITIQSLHKTLPAMTQTAVLHLSGDRVSSKRIREALDIFETSSPSYVLMNSVSVCMNLIEKEKDIFHKYVENLVDFQKECGGLEHIKILVDSRKNKDIGKIIISTKDTNISGVELSNILRNEYQIETELSSFAYVIAMTSIMDTKEALNNLKDALYKIDEKLEIGHQPIPIGDMKYKKILEPWEAKSANEETVDIVDAIGRISAGMICIYPPGVPIITYGEEITSNVIDVIMEARKKNLHVTGISDNWVSVVK